MNSVLLMKSIEENALSDSGYAFLSRSLEVIECTPKLSELLHEPVRAGMKLTDIFPECFGIEGFLRNLPVDGDPFTFASINRPTRSNQVSYLDLTIQAIRNSPYLFLKLVDRTDFGTLEQSLVQERNQLSLLQEQLMYTNKELQNANRIKSLMFSLSAHDLRAPLTVVRGFATLLEQDIEKLNLDDKSLLRWTKTLIGQTDWLDTQIHNIMALYQLEHDTLELSLEEVQINPIMLDLLHKLTPMSQLSEQSLRVIVPDEPIHISADRIAFQRILQNLIGNAIHYTPRQGKILVKAEQDAERSVAVITVSDTGIGMTSDQIKQVFDLYYRGGETAEEINGGGLGLYIVKMFVSEHNGTIAVESEPNKGSTFVVELPLHSA